MLGLAVDIEAAGIVVVVRTAAAELLDPLLDSTRPRRRHVDVGCKPCFPILSPLSQLIDSCFVCLLQSILSPKAE